MKKELFKTFLSYLLVCSGLFFSWITGILKGGSGNPQTIGDLLSSIMQHPWIYFFTINFIALIIYPGALIKLFSKIKKKNDGRIVKPE